MLLNFLAALLFGLYYYSLPLFVVVFCHIYYTVVWIFSVIKFSSVSYFQQFQKCLVFTALTQRDFHLYHYSFLFCLRFRLLILDRFSYIISFLNLNVLSPKFCLIQFVISGYRSFNMLFSLHSNPLSLCLFSPSAFSNHLFSSPLYVDK